jgi:hypothetical protein
VHALAKYPQCNDMGDMERFSESYNWPVNLASKYTYAGTGYANPQEIDLHKTRAGR